MMKFFFQGKFRIATGALFTVFAVGTVGYMLIEGWTFLESLYMTAITVSTVGYSEVEPLSNGGKIFSIFLIVFGVGVMFYTVTFLFEYVAEGYVGNILWRHRMKGQINKLKDHYIVCGYGRVGREVIDHIKAHGTDFVVIESNENAVNKAIEDGCLCLKGDVTNDEVLKTAGIEKARALIAAVGHDVDNVYVTLSAREFSHDIFIAARASNDDSEKKLRRAGANRVVFPERIGGRRMAMTVLRPEVVDFVDTTFYSRQREFSLQNIHITPNSPVAGMTVREGQRHCAGAIFLAVKKGDGALVTHPPTDMTVEPDDEIIVIGTGDQLKALQEVEVQS